MAHRKLLLLFTMLWLLLDSQPSHSQYMIQGSTFGNGGGAVINSEYQMGATMGQTATGGGSNSTYRSWAGIWYQLGVITTDVQSFSSTLPTHYRLDQNYPNPFNPSTTIRFALPRHSGVTLKLYNMLGRELAILIDRELPAGVHSVVFEAAGLPSGVYFYQLKAEEFVEVKKLMLMK